MLHSQTAIFSSLVKEFMRRPPLVVDRQDTVATLIERMTETGGSSVIVSDAERRVCGLITEHDVARRIALKAAPDTPLSDVMTHPVQIIEENDYLYRAIARMRRLGLRHMPVVNRKKRAVGMLDLDNALTIGIGRLMSQIDSLTKPDTVAGLSQIKAAQVQLAGELFEDSLPAPEIQGVITDINNGIYRRVVENALAAMASEGWGEPPVAFSVIVMGSGGRGENFLFPDQDNGFILDNYDDAEHDRIDGFFRELAERMCRDLNEIGFTYCNGYVMAVNPLWRKTISQWCAQIDGWMRRRNAVAIRLSDIFFDFRSVWGDQLLAWQLRKKIATTLPQHHSFLQEMYHDKADHNVALGLFGRFMVEKDNPQHRGKINLKHTGTIPLVEAARLMALRQGIKKTSTQGRLASLHHKKVLSNDEHEYLNDAFTLVSRLLLRQQLRDFQLQNPVSNYVHPSVLSRFDKARLRDTFKAIDRFRQRVRSEFTAEVF